MSVDYVDDVSIHGKLGVSNTLLVGSSLSAVYFEGDGSRLTDTRDNTKLPLSGGTLSGKLYGNDADFSNSVYSTTISAVNFYGNGSLLTGVATLTSTQTLKNKTVVDWMTLVRGYNTTPNLLTTITTGDIYTYVYTSSPTNITYYRYIASDGSEDSFYGTWNGSSLSNLIARKSIFL